MELETTKQHLPADLSLADQIKRDLEALSSQVESALVQRIRLSSKGFTTPDGTTGPSVKGIIIDFASANNHYPGVYDRENPTPPNCYAVGKIPNQLAPDPSSPEPQAETCAVCPKNKFESGVGKSKACKNTRVVALMQEKASEESPIWLLSVPPSSIRYFDTYVSTTLSGRHNIPPICAVTEITMDESQEFAAPRFKFDRLLTEEELAFYYTRKAEAESLLLQKPRLTGNS
jgi:hypothetical protein